jgi:hypothetical protein
MHPSLGPLLDRAFHRAPAREANSAIEAGRTLSGVEQPHSYEVLVDPEGTLQQLAEKVVPRLVYHLESRGSHPPGCDGVVLSLFVGETLYFVHAREAITLLAEALGLSMEELSTRFGTGELRRALRPGETPPVPRSSNAAPLMLPGKPQS